MPKKIIVVRGVRGLIRGRQSPEATAARIANTFDSSSVHLHPYSIEREGAFEAHLIALVSAAALLAIEVGMFFAQLGLVHFVATAVAVIYFGWLFRAQLVMYPRGVSVDIPRSLLVKNVDVIVVFHVTVVPTSLINYREHVPEGIEIEVVTG